jgi:hypothetical protein
MAVFKGKIIPNEMKIIIGGKHAKQNNYERAVGKQGIVRRHDTRWFSLSGAMDDGIEYCVEVPDCGRTYQIRKDDIILVGNSNKESKHLLERDY